MANAHSTLPSSRIKDIQGQRFGRLVVKHFLQNIPDQNTSWCLCQCDCGKEKAVRSGDLRYGRTKSCGCRWNWRHGKAGSKIYGVWQMMIQRCENPNHRGYKHYGARGITVCERWHEFVAFYRDMGNPPPGHTLDRVNNDGNYEPSNCRWATSAEQTRNCRRNHIIVFRGKSQCLRDWANELGIKETTLSGRFQRGWSIRRALTTPVKVR